MATGSITDTDREFTEKWENIAVSTHDIIRLDRRGEEVHEMISGRRTFMIRTEERLITQDRILDPIHDPFSNGAFRPVVVPDSVNIESNPNALSDEEILSILASSEIAWTEWMKVVDAPDTIRRMIDLAINVDISLRRYKELEGRLAVVSPKKQLTSRDKKLKEFVDGSDSPASRQAASGGLSGSYREPGQS